MSERLMEAYLEKHNRELRQRVEAKQQHLKRQRQAGEAYKRRHAGKVGNSPTTASEVSKLGTAAGKGGLTIRVGNTVNVIHADDYSTLDLLLFGVAKHEVEG